MISMINVLENAYKNIFPTGERICRTVYSGRFKDFGANIELRGNILTLKLSRKFYGVSEEIQEGLAQELVCKMFKKHKRTLEMDLYDNFIKSLHLAIPKTKSTPQLKESFDRINKKYFLELVEMPNVEWGKESKRTMGTYDFKLDKITISTILKNAPDYLLDYVMFHEVLHKQRKFERKGTKTRYHDKKFRDAERIFRHEDKNMKEIEKELQKFANKITPIRINSINTNSIKKFFFG